MSEDSTLGDLRASARDHFPEADLDSVPVLLLSGSRIEGDTATLASLQIADGAEIDVVRRKLARFSKELSKGTEDDAPPNTGEVGSFETVEWEGCRCVWVNREIHCALVADAPCQLEETVAFAISWNRGSAESLCLGVTPCGLDPRRDAGLPAGLPAAELPNAFFRGHNKGPMWFLDPYGAGRGVVAVDDGTDDPIYRARTLTLEPEASVEPCGTIVVNEPRLGDTLQISIDGRAKEAKFYHGDALVCSVPLGALYEDSAWPLYPAVWVTRPQVDPDSLAGRVCVQSVLPSV